MLFESLSATPTAMAFFAERTRFAAPGIAGGEDGATGELRIDGKPVDPKAQHIIRKGQRILLRMPGGGGYGPVAERRPVDAERDRRLGYVSAAASARRAAE